MKTKTRSLVLMAALAGITLLLGLTPIGYLRFGIIEMTLMGLPVIIGTMVLGWKSGLGLAAIFVVTSFYQSLSSPVAPTLWGASPIGFVVAMVVPRLLIPLTVTLVYRLVHTKKEYVNLGAASLVGSLTNTFLFLGILYLFFQGTGAQDMVLLIITTGLINGLCEAVLTTVLCPPIIRALKKSVPAIATTRPKETA